MKHEFKYIYIQTKKILIANSCTETGFITDKLSVNRK